MLVGLAGLWAAVPRRLLPSHGVRYGDPVSETSRSERAVWAGVAAVAAGHLSVDACMGIWPVFKVLARLDLGTAGLIAAAAAIAGNGLQLLFGPLADRGLRRLLIGAGVVVAGAVCFLPLAGSPSALLALMVVAAAGSAAFHPSAAGLAGGASRERSGLAVAVFLAGGYLGFAFSQLAFAAAYRGLPAGGVALFCAAPAALGLAFLAFRRAPASGAGAGPAARTAAVAAPGAAPWGRLAVLFAIQGLASAVGTAVLFLLPELFTAAGGGQVLALGGAHCLVTLAALAALVPAGMARDRLGARPVLLVTNLASGLCLAVLATRGATQPAILLASVLGFSALNAVNNVVALAEGTRLLAHRRSSASALLMGLPWIFSAPAPALAAWLAQPGRGGSPGMALAWMGVCAPAAALAALWLRPASRAPAENAPAAIAA